MSFNALGKGSFRIPSRELWPEGAFVRNKFGQRVLWLDREDGGHHLSADSLEPYRLLGDGHVDRILELLDKDGERLGPGDDLLLLAEKALTTEYTLRSTAQNDMASFLETYLKIPEWVDIQQLKRGQEVHLAYLPSVSLSLYYRSLVAGFSIPKIAAVVESTGYLTPPSRPHQTLQRLLDTGEFTVACTALGVDALLPGGIGWRTALHVRVLHAKVRYGILNRQGKKKWDVKKLGVPINQEDMAATLLAFSANVLFGIDLLAGNPVSKQEHLDYLALWRYIGWLLGVETTLDRRGEGQPTIHELPPLDPCGPGVGVNADSIVNSRSIFESIILHLLDPDESSVKISHHLLKVTDGKPVSVYPQQIPEESKMNTFFYYRCLNCRRMVGDDLADALMLPFHPNPWKRMSIRIMSTFFFTSIQIYTNIARLIKPARGWIIQWHTKALNSFHQSWSRSHKSKMAYALAKNEKAGILDLKNITIGDDYKVASCPFAMTAKPTL